MLVKQGIIILRGLLQSEFSLCIACHFLQNNRQGQHKPAQTRVVDCFKNHLFQAYKWLRLIEKV